MTVRPESGGCPEIPGRACADRGRPERLPLICLDSVDSTQSFLRRHPELGHCGVMAESQSEGRGRQGHRWESAPGAGLWLSAALPPPELPPGILLQRAMGAVIGALDGCGVELGLKWPNDLVARHGGRLVKLGGIIGERVGGRLILGLGVNLHAAPSLEGRAFPAMSLRELGAQAPGTRPLAQAILARWQVLAVAHPPSFLWPQEGEALRWEGGQGVCLGWEEDGRLRVAAASGVERLSAGDVRGLQA